MAGHLSIVLFIGFLTGTHTAIWGMYKDAVYEGIACGKCVRTIILSGLSAVIVQLLTGLDVTQASDILILYGMTYVTERGLFEFYKMFLREQDQSKYFIPMQFHVGGRIIESRRARWLVGAVCLTSVWLIVVGLSFMQQIHLQIPSSVLILFIGSIGGWVSACGGAWKDAPIEGFDIIKFFRSPVYSLVYSVPIACFTDNYACIVGAGIGYTISTLETYKTFFFPNKPPGKFAGKQIQYPEMLDKRRWLIPLYVTIWMAIITAGVIAFTQPHKGLI